MAQASNTSGPEAGGGPIMGDSGSVLGCPGEVGRTVLAFDPADSSDEERLQKGRSPCKGISAHCEV